MSTSTQPPSQRLQGKVAIVTGAASGFGLSITQHFVLHGAKVILADLNSEGGTRIAASNPDSMHFVQMNVAKAEDWERCLKEAVEKFGRVDVLVNNAGTSYRNKVRGVTLTSLRDFLFM